MKKNIGVVFDLDGVLVSTDHYHYLAWKKIADQLGIHFDESVNDQLRGVSRMESLEIILGDNDLTEVQKVDLTDRKNRYYRESLKTLTPDEVLPGVLTLLESLKSEKIPVGIGSSSKNAVTILEQVQLIDHFDVIIDGTKISQSKPDPEVFLKAAEAMALAPEYCVIFEDAQAGVEAGINGGMPVVGVGPAKRTQGVALGVDTLEQIDVDVIRHLTA